MAPTSAPGRRVSDGAEHVPSTAAGAPRFLFVPVSGPNGMGEYARCLVLAGAVRARWPGAAVHFLLSEQAPYARTTPYEHTLFPDSPTLHDQAGRRAIAAFAPDVVVFDNAGRKGQLATARAGGARVVYLSSRWRPRSKAFRLRWMRQLDEHWIPYPEAIGGALSRLERAKLRLLGRPRVRFLDVLLPAASDPGAVLARLGVEAERYVLVVPGGGSAHRGVSGAPQAYEAVARQLAAEGHAVVVAGPVPEGDAAPGVRRAGRLPPAELVALLATARLVVTNGGDTLLQSLACGRPTVAAPIALDQPQRLARCAARGGVLPVELDGDALANAALRVLGDEQARARLAAEARACGLVNGVDVALAAFAELLAAGPPVRTRSRPRPPAG